jgi:hypothetical protein
VLREERGSLARRDVERPTQGVEPAVVTSIAGRPSKKARTGFRWQRIFSTDARPWFFMWTSSASASWSIVTRSAPGPPKRAVPASRSRCRSFFRAASGVLPPGSRYWRPRTLYWIHLEHQGDLPHPPRKVANSARADVVDIAHIDAALSAGVERLRSDLPHV